MTRKIVIDLEMTTDVHVDDPKSVEDDRIYQVSLLEVDVDKKGNWKLTGNKLETLVNPDKPILPAADGYTHSVSDDDVKDKPYFAEIARDIHDFVGDSEMIVTCWVIQPDGKAFESTYDNITPPDGSYMRDADFLNKEMERAGFPPFPKEQYNNVKMEFSAVLGGNRASSLKRVCEHCGFDMKKDFGDHHDANVDAKALCAVMPQMSREYAQGKAEYDANKQNNVEEKIKSNFIQPS